MTKIEGIILEGEKLGIEKVITRDNKQMFKLHILNGFESMSLKIGDANLVRQLDEIPSRKPIRVKATVSIYKESLFMTATSIIN